MTETNKTTDELLPFVFGPGTAPPPAPPLPKDDEQKPTLEEVREAAASVSAAPPFTDETVLDEAARIVNGARQAQYGPPERNFEAIASLWTTYLLARGWSNGDLGARDVAMMQVLLKVARDAGGQPKRDNCVDIAGYAQCADLVTGG